ncbi:hypothetical protein RV11_GL003080 [Enterococcus phoeniculicola]|jgi:uncharacterized protein (TIGR01655 family)|uniref:YxeA family protein n=2 Tax=Enterococcus phoeniculicola TaxID=154621 RepID=R3W693_9ENTE|nr:hypothetical protein UC3_02079 [Enterococcus phoeniculicola ATCC BAA-412]EOT76540.1 hypothetical protein I589_01497 [Enterococcus phoeniculicola ATCC BAA-412]OJG72109.1 hypothetical protein RV11_GL003080 [Enterococcus phoeniculicola]
MDVGLVFMNNRYEVKIMKKIIGFFVVLLIFAGGSWFAYNYFYGGEAYYTQIVTEGEKETDQSSGETFTTYTYQQKAYNKDGEEKQVSMNAFRDRPLRLKAYLKLKVNPRKGVMEWEEIQQTDVPEKALEKLN